MSSNERNLLPLKEMVAGSNPARRTNGLWNKGILEIDWFLTLCNDHIPAGDGHKIDEKIQIK